MTSGGSLGVAIIGAGIAGSSIAAALAPEHRVTLLEMEDRPGYHATGRSAAVFVPDYGSETVRALSAASLPFLANPPDGFCDGPILSGRGLLCIARADQRDRLSRLFNGAPSGRGAMWLDADAAGAIIPVLRHGYVDAAYLDPLLYDIDVDRLHQAYLRRAVRHGACVEYGAAVEHLRHQNGQWQVETSRATFAASIVINAAGAWADHIASLAGLASLGLTPLRRTAALIPAPPGVAVNHWPMLLDCDESFYLKPDAGALLMSPCDATPQAPMDAYAEELDVATAADRLIRATTLDIRRVTHSWAGLRTYAPDFEPIIGFDPRVEGFFWSAGQGGFGIQTAPAWARKIKAVLDQDPEQDPIPKSSLDLSPARLLPGSGGWPAKSGRQLLGATDIH